MKNAKSYLSNQQGFNLLEVLIALAISSIVVVGSGKIMGHTLKSQAEIQIQSIVVNTLKSRIQNSNDNDSLSTCDAIETKDFIVGQTTYYVSCATVKVKISSTQLTEYPVLTASTNARKAQQCSTALLPDSDCFILGI